MCHNLLLFQDCEGATHSSADGHVDCSPLNEVRPYILTLCWHLEVGTWTHVRACMCVCTCVCVCVTVLELECRASTSPSPCVKLRSPILPEVGDQPCARFWGPDKGGMSEELVGHTRALDG
jgi:hypothetical protein